MAAAPPGSLSEWLRLMLAEIARKRDELERARAEEQQRHAERSAASDGERRGNAARS
jgi:hypothetical protein